MEAPQPIIITPLPINIEKELISIKLLFKNKKFDFNLTMVDENIIIFNLINKDENDYNKYQKEISFDKFKNMNKYFRQFDSLNEIVNDLISIINEKNIEIINDNKNEIVIQIKLLARNDNIININLNKIEINEKEKINILYNKYGQLKSIVDNNNTNILKLLEEKDKKINSLENELSELKNAFEKFKIEMTNKISKINSNSIEIIEITQNILDNSNIFKTKEEIIFLLGNITKNECRIKLIYNSLKDGENEEKLINIYTEKNDLIFLVKTDKNNRFGGYAHECFEKDVFEKRDKYAFLFNLNTKKVYKSKQNEKSIWRGKYTFSSINFGSGVDFKIFHNFSKGKNRAYPSGYDYEYNKEKFPLNNEEYFSISFLEIYQLILN